MSKLKLMTIIGTRPEIIRLSAVIKKCDAYFNQILVHTGQNYDYELNQVSSKIWISGHPIFIWMPPVPISARRLATLFRNPIN